MQKERKCPLEPVGDNIVIRLFEHVEKTKGGIIVPELEHARAMPVFKVVKVGPGRLVDSVTRNEMYFQEGQLVLMGGPSPRFDFTYGNVVYSVVNQCHVSAIVDSEAIEEKPLKDRTGLAGALGRAGPGARGTPGAMDMGK